MKRRTVIAATCLAILTLFSTGLRRSSAEPSRSNVGVALRAGAPAPFEGVLMKTAALAKLVTELEARAKRAEAALDAARAKARVAVKKAADDARVAAEACRRRVGACEGDLLRRERLYTDAVKRATDRPWYRSPLLWGAVGAAVGAGACGLAAGVTR